MAGAKIRNVKPAGLVKGPPPPAPPPNARGIPYMSPPEGTDDEIWALIKIEHIVEAEGRLVEAISLIPCHCVAPGMTCDRCEFLKRISRL